MSNPENNSVENEKNYLIYIQDYANKIWSAAAWFSYDCEGDIEKFKEIIKTRQLPHIEDCYKNNKDGLLQKYGEQVEELNSIIDQINSVDNAVILKCLINKALFVIYPKRGYNQEYPEAEFSADKL